MPSQIINVTEEKIPLKILNVDKFIVNGVFQIYTKDRRHSVHISFEDDSKCFFVQNQNEKYDIAKTHTFENALISAVSYLNTFNVYAIPAWWLKDYTNEGENWYLAHGMIIYERYLKAGHNLIYYIENGLCILSKTNSSYMVDIDAKMDKEKHTLYETFDEAVAYIKQLDAKPETTPDVISEDIFDKFAQSIFEKYITYADHWLRGVDYEDTNGNVWNRNILSRKLNSIDNGPWLPYPSITEFRRKCVDFVLERQKEIDLLRWNDYSSEYFSDPNGKECAVYWLKKLIEKFNPMDEKTS